MKRGDIVFVKRPKRFLKATLVATYDFPAARIMFHGEEMIVGRNEVVSQEERDRIILKRERDKIDSQYDHILNLWQSHMTWEQWKEKRGYGSVAEFQQIKKLKRLGVIW